MKDLKQRRALKNRAVLLALLLAMPASVLFGPGQALPSVPNRGSVFDPGLADSLDQSGYAARVLFDAAQFSGRGPVSPYRMYFVNGSGAMQLATSGDGTSWANHTSPLTGLFSCPAGAAGTVIYDAAGFGRAAGPYFRIYYSNCGTPWNAPLNTAVSFDGVNWQNDTTIVGLENRGAFEARVYGIGGLVFQPEGLPQFNTVQPLFNRWLLYYVAGPMNGTSQSIGLAVSRDGVNFVRLPVHVFTPQEGAWDARYVGAGTVTRIENGTLSLWYAGGTSSPAEGVGLATSSDGVIWTRQTTSPIFSADAGFGQSSLRGGPAVIFDANRFKTVQGHFTGDGSHYKLWQSVLSTDGRVRVAYASIITPPPVFDPLTIVDRLVLENKELKFFVMASDPSGGAVTFSSPASDRPAGSSFNSLSNNSAFLLWTPTFTQAGVHTARITARSQTAQATATLNITVVDVNRPPVARIFGPDYLGLNVTGNFSAVNSSDPDGDPLNYVWTLPDGSISVSMNVSLLYASLADQGSKRLDLNVTDASGASAFANFTTIVDGVAPVTNVSLNGTQRPNGYYNSTVRVEFSVTDNLAGVAAEKRFYNIDGGPYQVVPAGSKVSLGQDKTFVVGYYSVDRGGNAEAPKYVAFSVSREGPLLTIVSPQRANAAADVSVIRENSVHITAFSSDPNGIARVEFFVDGGLIGTVFGDQTVYDVVWNSAASGTGLHTIDVVSTDLGAATTTRSLSVLKLPV